MRRWFALVLLALAGGLARADEPPSPAAPVTPAPNPKPASPATPEQAADAVVAAFATRDTDASKALAAKDDPDPWLVADELIRRGEFDAADAFAKAAPHATVEGLAIYVTGRRAGADDVSRRAKLAAGNAALASGKPVEALSALGEREVPAPTDVVGVRLAFGRGLALRVLTRAKEATEAFLDAADQAEACGWLARAVRAIEEAGKIAIERQDARGALGHLDRRMRLHERLGDRRGKASALSSIGNAFRMLGEYPKALEAQERSLKLWEELGDEVGVISTLGNLGNVHRNLGNYPKALELYQRVLEANERLGNRSGIAVTLVNIGVIYRLLGDFQKALDVDERALRLLEGLADRRNVAKVLANIGAVHQSLGNYAKAQLFMERALDMARGLGDRPGVAAGLTNLGLLHSSLGDQPRAMAYYERALEETEALGDRAATARALVNMGAVCVSIGDGARALELLDRALAEKHALSDRAGAAGALGLIGDARSSLGEFAQAIAWYDRALKAWEELRNRAGMARIEIHAASAAESLGDHSTALRRAGKGLALAREVGSPQLTVQGLLGLARVHLARGSPAEALPLARQAALDMTGLVGGLADEQGASARAEFAKVFDVGAATAAALDDVAGVGFFLESGRAGALLEGLGGRERLWSHVLTDALRTEDAAARAGEAVAVALHDRALDGGDLTETRRRRAELDAARATRKEVIERIQRADKAVANVVQLQVNDLDTMRKRLATDEALVMYGLLDEGPLALVVTSAGATTAKLPPTKDVEASCGALLAAIDERAGPEATSKAADALRDLVVKPLGLAPGTKRLLISPDGALSYIPFTLLAPERDVVYVPSGTTYGLLLEDGKARGEGVVALGDPDYDVRVDQRAAGIYHRGGAGRLERLPATADEAKAVGGTVLLGENATEKGLREAVGKRPRWRAVHFACHGLIDAERPGFSSLALTADGDDDGFLTVLEVFRSKIPADLVVLSACETAKGKVVKGEGIMGLTRAFMFAGSPRVICSLWKVDDDATRALMTKFYELWNPKDGKPGLPTAEALRKAQEFVKSQEKWQHPYYWAAWVLWGLPD